MVILRYLNCALCNSITAQIPTMSTTSTTRYKSRIPSPSNFPNLLAPTIRCSSTDLVCIFTSPSTSLERQQTGLARTVVGDQHISIVVDPRGAHNQVLNTCRHLPPRVVFNKLVLVVGISQNL